jgi:hypothetical protein
MPIDSPGQEGRSGVPRVHEGHAASLEAARVAGGNKRGATGLLSMTVWRTYNAILDACSNAWNTLMRDAERIASVTTRTWAQVKT